VGAGLGCDLSCAPGMSGDSGLIGIQEDGVETEVTWEDITLFGPLKK
jgi:hypothetical protein